MIKSDTQTLKRSQERDYIFAQYTYPKLQVNEACFSGVLCHKTPGKVKGYSIKIEKQAYLWALTFEKYWVLFSLWETYTRPYETVAFITLLSLNIKSHANGHNKIL